MAILHDLDHPENYIGHHFRRNSVCERCENILPVKQIGGYKLFRVAEEYPRAVDQRKDRTWQNLISSNCPLDSVFSSHSGSDEYESGLFKLLFALYW